MPGFLGATISRLISRCSSFLSHHFTLFPSSKSLQLRQIYSASPFLVVTAFSILMSVSIGSLVASASPDLVIGANLHGCRLLLCCFVIPTHQLLLKLSLNGSLISRGKWTKIIAFAQSATLTQAIRFLHDESPTIYVTVFVLPMTHYLLSHLLNCLGVAQVQLW